MTFLRNWSCWYLSEQLSVQRLKGPLGRYELTEPSVNFYHQAFLGSACK